MRSNTRRPLFPCQNEECQYTSTEFKDFHTSVVLQTAPENSLILKVTEDMLGISTLGFTTLILNVMTKMPQFPIRFY